MNRPDFVSLGTILNALQQAKGRAYGNSWERRGEMGILHQVFRKMDRIENLVYDFEKTSKWVTGTESLPETVADLAVYALLWLSRCAETQEKEFLDWLTNAVEFAKMADIPEKVKENAHNAYEFLLSQSGSLPTIKE